MNLQDYAEQLLFGQRLEDKLLKPQVVTDHSPLRSWARPLPKQPGRPELLRWHPHARRHPFPRLHELADPKIRGTVLHFFANHELLAIEIMALALLRFPDAPASFQSGLLRTIGEEQTHLLAYQERMNELGVHLGDVPVNLFFWECLRTMQEPLDFVVGMSLTFEQANLDFARFYRDRFQELGDLTTAAILQKVYDDEIGHVKHGVAWLERWKASEDSQWQAYQQRLHLPLSPARAKGPQFDREARKMAQLDDDYCDHLEVFAGSKGRPPALYWYNADCERELEQESTHYEPKSGVRAVLRDSMASLMFLAKPGDIVLVDQEPTLAYRKSLQDLGFSLPEFECLPDEVTARTRYLRSRLWDRLYPWGWTPRSVELAQAMKVQRPPPLAWDHEVFQRSPWMSYFRKASLPDLRRELRHELQPLMLSAAWGPIEADGHLCRDRAAVMTAIEAVQESFARPAVIKSPLGFAGTGMLRAYPGQGLSEAQVGWIDRQIARHGSVLVEPWLERLVDISLVWSEDNDSLSSFVFLTNAKGQYRGHELQPLSHALTPEHRAILYTRNPEGFSLHDGLQKVAHAVRRRLAAAGYHYAAGIDTMLFSWRGQTYVRILGEINCRMTMGHLARSLRQHINPRQTSVWHLITRQEAEGHGWQSLEAMANTLQAQCPPQLREGLVTEGIFFTHDPATSRHVLGLVAVGTEARKLCEWLT